MTARPPRAVDHGSTRRIEALSDGIFAIAMTLLIINLRVPSSGTDSAAAVLRRQGGPLLAFGISFVVLAVFWFGHRQQFAQLTHTDHPLIWLNLLQLALVCLTPFTASLLGRFPLARLADLVYGADLTAIGLAHWAMWRYAAGPGQLITHDLDPSLVALTRRLAAIPAAGYALATASTLISPSIAMTLFAISPIPFVTGTYYRLLARHTASSAKVQDSDDAPQPKTPSRPKPTSSGH